jgi:TP901 family phage tail tape measure protein
VTDRTVTVRLRLDNTGVLGPAAASSAAFERVGASATAAATSAQAAAARTNTAVNGTFSSAQRASTAAVTGIESAATRSSMALANTATASARATTTTAQAAARSTTTAATAAARATTTAADAAARATSGTAASAGQVAATFRAAGASAVASLGEIDAATARSSLALAGMTTGMSAATAAAAAGTNTLSLSNRLSLAQSLRASQGVAATQATTATGYRALGAAAVASGSAQAAGWRSARVGALAFVGIFVAAAAVTAHFDKSMSGVQAVSQATTGEMVQLRGAALEAGKATAFTASQAADAEGELARAGVSVADITGGALKGSLSLAAAGQLSLADAATISAQAMNTFGLKGKDVGHIADVLAAGANKSAADVNGLALALRQGGLVAKQTGLSLEDTVGVLSAFADHALIGSDAGTSLKTMLQRLTPQSQQAQDMMDKLGLKTYDAQGNFVGLAALAGNMQKAFAGLTPEARNSAMAVIFGSDAVRGASVLYGLGASGIQKYVNEVNDSGAANRMASTQLNNLSGDLKAFQGSLEVALIESGSAANGVLRDMVKWLTDVINAYASMPSWLQGSAIALIGLVGAIALVGTTFILALPKIAAFQTAMVDLSVTMPRVASAVSSVGSFLGGPFGIAIGIGITALAAFGAANKSSTLAVTDFSSAIQADTGHIGEHTRALAAQALAQNGAFEAAKKYGIAQSTVLSAALGDATAMGQVNTTLDAQIKAMGEHHDASGKTRGDLLGNWQSANKLREALNGTNGQVKTAISSYKDQGAALTGATDGTKKLGDQSLTTADDLRTQQTAVQKLTDALNSLNGVNITAAEDQIHFQGSLADLTKAVHDNGHSLDVHTAKGRAVKQAFLDAAQAAMAHAEAVADQTNSVDKGNAALERDITALTRTMRQAGFTKAQIKELTAAYAQVPTSATTKVTAPGATTVAGQLEAVKAKILATPGAPKITVTALTSGAQAALRQLGFTVTALKDHQIQVTLPTHGPLTAADTIQARVDQLHGKRVDVQMFTTTTSTTISKYVAAPGHADGAVYHRGVRAFAQGGEDHSAQIAPGGAMRLWAEPETGGESYIPLAAAKRHRSKAILEKTAAIMGGRVAWFGDGGVTAFAGGGTVSSFQYTPSSAAVLGGTGDAMTRYTNALAALAAAVAKEASTTAALAKARTNQSAVRLKEAQALEAAEKHLADVRSGKHTHKELVAAEDRLTRARQTAAAADAKAAAGTTAAARAKAAADAQLAAADKNLGVAKGTTKVTGFDLAAYKKQLADSLAATRTWRTNLSAVGARGGTEVQSILEGMGQDGAALTAALAKASKADFATITANLKAVGDQAKVTLSDFDAQVNASAKTNAQFAGDLTALAARGYGTLAQQLAGQGDQAAMDLAHQAVTASPSQLAKLNADVGAQAAVLTGQDLQNALLVISSLRSKPGEGIGDVVRAGISASDLIALTPKILAQIQALPDANKAVFLAQWAGQSAGVTAMYAGGILPDGPGMVLAGERGTGGEAWIPLGPGNRARSTGILAETAARFGYQLVAAGAFSPAGGGTSHGPTHVTRHNELHLHGAKQDSATQAQDLLRHMAALS